VTNSILPDLGLRDLAGQISTQRVKVTPTTAAKWIARNHGNRTLSQHTVDQYASDMTAGKWVFTGQPMVFDAKGWLIDGQHRLTAQIKAGVTLDWLVVVGVETETRDYIDIGRTRSVGNQLQIKGIADGNGIAAVARLDLIYDGLTNPSKPTVRAHCEDHAEAFHEGARMGRSIAQVIHGSTAAYGVAHYRLSQIDPDAAQEFFEALLTGAGLPLSSPILVARNHIARTRSSRSLSDAQRVVFIDYLFKTWNLWRTGKRVKSFSMPACRVEPVALAGPKAA
jgi:hypothetical protein